MTAQQASEYSSFPKKKPAKHWLGSLLAPCLLLMAAPAAATNWQGGYQDGLWEASEPSQLQCELNHYIPDFGAARFIHRSGEEIRLEIDTFRHALRRGRVDLVALAPDWQPGLGTRNLGYYQLETTDYPLEIGTQETELILESLRQGRMPSLVQTAADERVQRRRASMTPVRFHQAFADFQACQAQLLPVNYDQIGDIMINFNVGNNSLSAADREKLDLLVRYVHADPEIERVHVDGHSDSTGTRTRNRELSHERAQNVTRYLVARGLSEDLITTQFHGQRYPIADNRTQDGRYKNRRVTIKLERELDIRPLF
ncbi:OmpA family protein [Marinospirillum celere]|uniref:OmpA family protein n=1 Tax=Marinospirillum celere TaxID=1122252 RepID=A0A1I1EDK3_9GAMM|nr:OmpA family protein [Marinospirillum celere]SFB85234.1 OmpA family protein [Marinospirillum celere]